MSKATHKIYKTRETDSKRDREAKPHINKNTASVHASASAAAAVAVPQHTLSLSGARIWCGGTRGEDTSTHGGKDTRTNRRHTHTHAEWASVQADQTKQQLAGVAVRTRSKASPNWKVLFALAPTAAAASAAGAAVDAKVSCGSAFALCIWLVHTQC